MIIDKEKSEMHLDGLDDLLKALNLYENEINGKAGIGYWSNSFCPYTYSESIDMLKSGWPEGVQKAVKLKEEIEPIGKEAITSIEYDVTGDYIDMGAFMSGVPECMASLVQDEGPTNTVKIMVHSGALSDVSADTMARRGASVMAVIEALQQDYLVDVILCNRVNRLGRYTNKTLSIFLKLNTLNEYSRDLLAFYIVNPAFHRRITFALRELYLGYGTKKVGATIEIKPEHIDNDNTIYFESLEKNRHYWETKEGAKKRAMQIIEEFNRKQEKN